MIREKVEHTDFFKIAKENDFFLWHFLQKDQKDSGILMYSVFDKNPLIDNTLLEVLDNCSVPYFESYTEDSIDFLAGLGFDYKKLYVIDEYHINVDKKKRYRPLIIGFKKFTKVHSTFEVCYCPEGVIEILSKMNPKYIEELMENIEKNPD